MKNVLNYFVRKAFGFKSTATAEDKTLFGHLLRIQRNIQGVYDWLYARCPADAWWLARRMPMTEAVTDPNDGHEVLRPVLQNSDNLLAHLRLLDGRKISNGYADGTPADDGLPDGVSLARILCDSSLQPTELIDDNVGWTWDMTFTAFPSAKRITINAAGDKVYGSPLINHSGVEVLNVPYLNRVEEGNSSQGSNFFKCPNLQIFNLDRLTFWQGGYLATEMPLLKELNMPNCSQFLQSVSYGGFKTPALEKMVLGKLTSFKLANNHRDNWFASCPNLLHLEVGEGTACNLPLDVWSPTLDSSNLSLFLDNFLHFIAERVAEGNFTLTLSAAVYAALEQQEGQTILALLNTKGWTVASA